MSETGTTEATSVAPPTPPEPREAPPPPPNSLLAVLQKSKDNIEVRNSAFKRYAEKQQEIYKKYKDELKEFHEAFVTSNTSIAKSPDDLSMLNNRFIGISAWYWGKIRRQRGSPLSFRRPRFSGTTDIWREIRSGNDISSPKFGVDFVNNYQEVISTNVNEPEKKDDRILTFKVLNVDKKSEIVEIVMVLDRNGRPMANALKLEDNQSSAGSSVSTLDSEDKEAPEVDRENHNKRPMTYQLPLQVLISDTVSLLSLVEEKEVTTQYTTFIPKLTYQRLATSTSSEPEFALVDVGARLGLPPLLPLDEYEPIWGTHRMKGLRHTQDGNLRFEGLNETGFGFLEDKPIKIWVKKEENHANILSMILFDTNDQVAFDTEYAGDEEDLEEKVQRLQKDGIKLFKKDAMGNKLAYKIICQNGTVKEILYPFQSKVKRAKLEIQVIDNLYTTDSGENYVKIDYMGITFLAKLDNIPNGLIVGNMPENEAEEEEPSNKLKFGGGRSSRSIKSVQEIVPVHYEKTVFLDDIRRNVRTVADLPGLVELTVIAEEGQYGFQAIPKTSQRHEAWPVECIHALSESEIQFLQDARAVAAQAKLDLVRDCQKWMEDHMGKMKEAKFKELDQFLNIGQGLAEKLANHEELRVKGFLESIRKLEARVKRATVRRKKKMLKQKQMSADSI